MAEIQVRALYAFEGETGAHELSFGADEILTIVRQDVGEGWWEAKNSRGQTGLIPEAYVEVSSLPEPSMPPPPPPMTYTPSKPWQPSQNNIQTLENNNQTPYQTNDNWQAQPSAPPAQPPVPQWQGQSNAAYQQDTGTGALTQQGSYDDWDDDWDDDDSSTTTETPDMGSVSNTQSGIHRDKRDDGHKFGTVRKTFNRFSVFSKAGGDDYLFGNTTVQVSESDKTAVVSDSVDGPVWKAVSEPYTCMIASPKKESKFKGIKSFIAYQLTPSFSNIQVSRRYKHFDWLHERLVAKFPSIVVPPLPDKQISGRYEEDFIQERMRQLQLWVDRMCRHPIICHSEVYHHFLSCTDDKRWKQGKRKAEKDEYQGGMFFLTVQTPAAPLDPKQTDQQLEKFGRFIKSMDDSVKHLIDVADSNMKKHQGPFKKEFSKIGRSFKGLAMSFDKDPREAAKSLTSAINHTGVTYEDIGKLFEEQPRYDLIPMLESMHEYKGLTSTWPDVLQVHKASLAKVQECQKTQQEGKMSESDAQAVAGRAEVISYAALAEMNHFQSLRVGDFKYVMQTYLKGQIDFYKKITSKLEDALRAYENA